jgi:hypothetical protein
MTATIETHEALSALLEWISSPLYKQRATWLQIAGGISWCSFLPELFEDMDNFNRHDPDYKLARSKFDAAKEVWLQANWVDSCATTKGRPRKAEYSEKQISRAHSILHGQSGFYEGGSSGSRYWAQCILNEHSTRRTLYVINYANLASHLIDTYGESTLVNRTREEIANILNISKPAANRIVKELTASGGWTVTKALYGKRRELRPIKVKTAASK